MQYNHTMELKELVKDTRKASFVKPSSVEYIIPETRKLIKKVRLSLKSLFSKLFPGTI